MRLVTLILGLVFLLPARAATVAVSVRERGGGPISEQWVVIHPTGAPGEVVTWDRARNQLRVKGADGKVVFEPVPVGRYTIDLEWIARSGLINPAANPPSFTRVRSTRRTARSKKWS